MTKWRPDLSDSNAPRYVAIANAIDADIGAGRLKPGDRLPAQRQLAKQLGLDFTTVARGYSEARRRGAISSQVGSGSYVAKPAEPIGRVAGRDLRRKCPPDFSMNLPPEPDAPELIARMQEGIAAMTADLLPLLRYQSLETSGPDIQAAAIWLQNTGLAADPARIQIAPGAQAAMLAILTGLTAPGDTIACEAVTYPGIRSICAQLRLKLTGLACDEDGPDPEAFQAACKTQSLKALYLNPTLHNPTARTISLPRRKELCRIAQRYGVAILEDDPYSQLKSAAPLPLAAIAPDVTWYIGSLSKSLGAGLRLAYVLAPDKADGWKFSRAARTSYVMTSPLQIALATRWIEDGTAQMLLAYIRRESAARQTMATGQLKRHAYFSDMEGFHLWLPLPEGWNRSTFVSQMRSSKIGLVESDAFTVAGPPQEAVRLCLGGPVNRDQLQSDLEVVAETLSTSPQSASVYF